MAALRWELNMLSSLLASAGHLCLAPIQLIEIVFVIEIVFQEVSANMTDSYLTAINTLPSSRTLKRTFGPGTL
jgi:hypothetical protein